MKKIAVLIAAVVLCTGCQSREANSDGAAASTAATESTTTSATPESTAAESAEAAAEQSTADAAGTAETAEPVSAEVSEYLFKQGVWRGSTEYYFFGEEGSGQYLAFDTGIGLAFRVEPYSEKDGTVTFHIAEEENNTVFTVTDISEESVTMIAEDGTSDTLVYVGEGDASTFVFYTNDQVGQIALQYYTAQTGYTPSLYGTQSNTDGTVTVQLYDQAEDGHNSTAAWYTVDRVTLTGTDDTTGEEVDMSAYAEGVL